MNQLHAQPEKVTPEARFAEDLKADSLDTIELIMALEEEFKIEIPDEDAEEMRQVKDVIAYVGKRLEERDGGDRES